MAKKKISGLAIVGVLVAAGLGIWYFTKKKKEDAGNSQIQKNTGSPVEMKIKASEAGATGQKASGYGKM